MASADATEAAHPLTDLDCAASYARMCANAAQRAHDVRFRGAQVARMLCREKPLPTAEQFEDDFLAQFDRLSVIAERVRASRAPQLERAA